ncbi:hypothetical protein [Nonomuraea sp. NPDC023979]|uniref:hypothetical protein n=1 Tax=Nonomuraea sp. NPDC023979 TaxID=3154796 RepID=UPI0033FDED31
MRTRARLLLLSFATGREDPVAEADRCTSTADARIGLCLAAGVDIKDIDPALGFDYSAASYERVRASWRNLARVHGFSHFHDGPAYEAAIARWRARRPDLVVDGWLGPEEEWARRDPV